MNINNSNMQRSNNRMLYDSRRAERDACGVGFIATTTGRKDGILELAVRSLQRLAHRGALGADAATGDGAGILTQIPMELFRAEAWRLFDADVKEDELGVGTFFFPREDDADVELMKALVRQVFAEHQVRFLGWREVPVREETIGEYARRTAPLILHGLFLRPEKDTAIAFERRLYGIRRAIERRSWDEGLDELYVASLSAQTIVYKGLLMTDQLPEFYVDLADDRFKTALALYHQRYSTNTMPTWRRAQPFRMLAHNGEINTLQGNINWMRAREANLQSPILDSGWLRPVIQAVGSDSAMLDNAMELLATAGRGILHAAMMMIPEAWENASGISAAHRGFYRYHAGLMEPWDGPAAIVFSDGRLVGAALDRNGLRPMRYTLTDDGLVLAGSEVGATPVRPDSVIKHGRLGPGQMIAVDVIDGRILENDAAKDFVVSKGGPYGDWLAENRVVMKRTKMSDGESSREELGDDEADRVRRQAAFGYTSEELTVVIRPMVEDAKDPNGSMGDDTPQAVLSRQNRPLYHFFKERFAEVTNPPMDHLRERVVFSLRTLLGPRGNLLQETEAQAKLIELESPILLDDELERLRQIGESRPAFQMETVAAVFPVQNGPQGLEAAVHRLCRAAEAAVDRGAGIVVISDRNVDAFSAPIPALMAIGSVHHHLIHQGKRNQVSLVVESGEPREVHHFATLLGYGASAINPYLALESAAAIRLRGTELSPAECRLQYRKAVEEGLLKIMSKMGISTVDSYTGAQIFEAVGLNHRLIAACFPGTISRVEGNDFEDIAKVVLNWHTKAFAPDVEKLGMYGFYKPRKEGEFHEYTPATARLLHRAIKIGEGEIIDPSEPESWAAYQEFTKAAKAYPGQLSDLLDFAPDRSPIPLEEVEPVEEIVKRFSTAQMSLGALSPEAHATLAVAMNRIGARSGSGEGGEDKERLLSEANSAVKQIASGRFGVTPAYLASAKELQIKMAQGSKPGEGGQIPGHKVTDLIARLRHTVPGVALISPPPHHDIYSIEDLTQLIYDLKCANPAAEISVKLVSQSGVGIIASGVAKGYADLILVSGNSGGTGSSPLNSIKNAGLPWEIGLAETQQALLANGLRNRVGLRVDGGLKTGRDVVVAALLGADEFSFGTAAMIAEGCVMARVCHTNNCPVGVASQKPELREKFVGAPESVINYFLFVAQEVRHHLARLGFRRVDEAIGRVENVRQVSVGHPASDRLDLSLLLGLPENAVDTVRHREWSRNPGPSEKRLDDVLIAQSVEALVNRDQVQLEMSIDNTQRTVGAGLSYEIACRYGDEGLPPGTIQIRFTGQAGQSFAAFNSHGMNLTLVGEANDYVGKGMAGGEVAIRPHPDAKFKPSDNVIVGNTVLYGATGGEFFAAGRAGERFAVRNSGATAVIEGVGDHGCEYMTSGTVVVLGPIGYNFGAGMTGGEAFILDETGVFHERYNPQLVGTTTLGFEEQKRLRRILLKHYEKTGSPKAAELLRHWQETVPKFLRVAPLQEIAAGDRFHQTGRGQSGLTLQDS